MATNDLKNKNSQNLFLNNYFNIMMVGVVIVVLAIAYFIIIKPKYDATMASINITIQQQKRLYTEQLKKLNNLKTIADLYKKISPTDLNKFNGVLPDDYVRERLYGELEEIVATNGFILNSVSIEQEPAIDPNNPAPVENGKLGKVNLQLSISAIDYAGFKNLLRLFESNLRIFDITRLSFSPGGNTASLEMTTYYYKK
ncbi:MAG: hypothetical protein WC467_03355 [Patescibacteria group bacterium]